MIYHSVAEIYEAMGTCHKRFTERVEVLNAEQQSFRPSSDHWSIAEIAEHLAIIDEQIVILVGKLLARAEAGVEVTSNAEVFPVNPVSLRQQLEEAGAQKYQSPEAARPRGGVSISDSLERINAARAALNALRPRLERVDLSEVRFPHPFFGPLNLYQWLAFLPLHQERHLRQIERLMDTPEYERRH